MKRLSLSFSLGIVLSLASCDYEMGNSVPIKADFEIEISGHYPSGNSITLTNKSEGADSFEWDLGDGNASSEESPKHVFASGGTYSITLTAYRNGNTDSVKKVVEVGYSFMVIHKIEVSSFPETKSNGEVWDNDLLSEDNAFKSNPDLLIEFKLPILSPDDGPYSVWYDEIYENAETSMQPFLFSNYRDYLGRPQEVISVEIGQVFSINLFDVEEGNKLTLMMPSVFRDEFWKTVEVGNEHISEIGVSNGSFGATLYVSWR
jgi:hypothetical protein